MGSFAAHRSGDSLLLTFDQAVQEVLKRNPKARFEFVDCGIVCVPEVAQNWQIFKRGKEIQEQTIYALRENFKEIVYLEEDGVEVSVCRARFADEDSLFSELMETIAEARDFARGHKRTGFKVTEKMAK
jgi:hypothetical protein